MRKLVVALSAMLALCLCGNCLAEVDTATTTEQCTVPYLETTEIGGAGEYGGSTNHADSLYYAQPDFYNAVSNASLTILPKYRTYQQTTEWSCGPASIMTVIDYADPTLSAQYDDVILGEFRGKETNSGLTTLSQMQAIYDKLGWEYMSTLNTEIELDNIDPTILYEYVDAGLPVCVGWMDWGGHWTALIGYDTMGTDSYYDDVLIMADPYDTTDHLQDGYTIVPADRFFYLWKLDMEGVPENEVYYPFIAAYPAGQAPEIAE